MDYTTVKLGSDVNFFPSEDKLQDFEHKREHYPAKITDVNKNSVDLTVFAPGQVVFVNRIPFELDVKAGRSCWAYQEK